MVKAEIILKQKLDEGLHRSLMDLGLSNYESKAFAALCLLGKASAKEICELSGVPQPRVYGILTKLQKRGLIFGQRQS